MLNEIINSIKKSVRRKRLEIRLANLQIQQAQMNKVVADAMKETNQLIELHEKETTRLAKQRTAVRTALARL